MDEWAKAADQRLESVSNCFMAQWISRWTCLPDYQPMAEIRGPAGDGQAGEIRADLVGNTVTTYNAHTYQTINGQPGNFYFNPNNFSNARENTLNAQSQIDPASLIGQFTYGSFPRNALRGPGFIDTDLSVAKHFLIGEKLDAELRADAFNVFNHANFANPDTNITDNTFGTISSVVGASSNTNPTGPRILQLALHLRF